MIIITTTIHGWNSKMKNTYKLKVWIQKRHNDTKKVMKKITKKWHQVDWRSPPPPRILPLHIMLLEVDKQVFTKLVCQLQENTNVKWEDSFLILIRFKGQDSFLWIMWRKNFEERVLILKFWKSEKILLFEFLLQDLAVSCTQISQIVSLTSFNYTQQHVRLILV